MSEKEDNEAFRRGFQDTLVIHELSCDVERPGVSGKQVFSKDEFLNILFHCASQCLL